MSFTSSASRRIGCVLAILSAIGGMAALQPAQAEPRYSFAGTPGKLSKDVVPSAYRIELAPDLDKLSFTGTVEIDVDVAKPTDTVTLDAIDLSFSSVTLKAEDLPPAKVTLDAKAETASFHFARPLAKGKHTLVIAYSGQIPATPSGLYYNDYTTPQGKERMLVSQFEATDARRALPSWDEPVFKATFELAVTLPKDLAVISNTPVASEQDAGQSAKGVALKKTTFGRTPRMSTYLLVLCAGHLERVHDASTGTDIGVWTVAGKAEQGRYALEVANKVLPYYNEYFGVPYPLPKLDLVAVPGNFAAGAMENWGAITFIDNVLLFDPASSSEATKQRIYLVIAHEMAHQWSGDLVTMAWWNNIWLNEGFASWMDAKSTDVLNPDWQFWLRQHASNEGAMAADARSTSHPIQANVRTEDEIGTVFDSISYNKGQAFLRMIETYIGADEFRAGMRQYMKTYQYASATTADLWAALDQASGKPVSKIAAGFTEQPGVPLIRVAAVCKNGKTEVALTQDRFTINDPKAKKLSWDVPVQLAVIGGTEAPKTVLVTGGKASAEFAGCGNPVKANFGDVGYFRTQYDAANLRALTKLYKQLSPADRVNLVADVWAMVQAGREEPDSYMELTRQLSGETTLVVWTQVIGSFDEIDDLMRDAPDRPAFRRYASELLKPVLAQLGWDAKPGEDSQVGLLRAELIEALGKFGEESVVAESRKRFEAFVADPASLPPNLREPVLDTVGRYADHATFDKLRALGRAASGTEERLRYYYALAGAQDPALIDQAIGVALTDEISNGRVNRYLIKVAHSSDHPDLVWKGVVANRGPIMKKLPDGFREQLLPSIANASINPAIARELKTLPESSANAGAKIEAAKSVEQVQSQVRFKAKLTPALSNCLRGAGS